MNDIPRPPARPEPPLRRRAWRWDPGRFGTPGAAAEIPLVQVDRLGRRVATAAAAALRPLGIKPREVAVLDTVQRLAPTTQKGVAKWTELDPATVSRLVDGLERAGLLARGPSVVDGRRRVLDLTPAGEQLLVAARRTLLDESRILLYPLPGLEAARTIRALRRVERALARP